MAPLQLLLPFLNLQFKLISQQFGHELACPTTEWSPLPDLWVKGFCIHLRGLGMLTNGV